MKTSKRIRRYVAMLLIFCLAVLSMAGCSEEKKPEPGRTRQPAEPKGLSVSDFLKLSDSRVLVMYFAENDNADAEVTGIYVFRNGKVKAYLPEDIERAFDGQRLGALLQYNDDQVATRLSLEYEKAHKKMVQAVKEGPSKFEFLKGAAEYLISASSPVNYHYYLSLDVPASGGTGTETIFLPKPTGVYSCKGAGDFSIYRIGADGEVVEEPEPDRCFNHTIPEIMELVGTKFVMKEAVSGEIQSVSYTGFKDAQGQVLITKTGDDVTFLIPDEAGTAEVYVNPKDTDYMGIIAVMKGEIYDPTPSWEPLDLDGVTITVWSPIDETDSEYIAVKMAIEDMRMRYPAIRIVWETSNRDAYKMKIRQAAKTKQLPDVFYVWSESFLGEFVEEDLVYCLDTEYQKHSGSLKESMCESTSFGGHKYGMPLPMNYVGLFANMDILREVGYNEVPTTIEEFLKCCDDLVAAGKIPFGCAGREAWCVSEYVESILLKTCGADTLRKLFRGEAGWNNEYVAEAITLFQNMIDRYFDPAGVNSQNDEIKQNFINGKYAFYMNGSWNCSDFANCSDYDIQLAEFPVVRPEMATLGQLIGGPDHALVVSQAAPDKERIAEYVFELSQLINKYCCLDGAGLPAWTVDYDMTNLNPLTQSAIQKLQAAEQLVVYGDAAMTEEDMEIYYTALSRIYEKALDGQQFINHLSTYLR